MRSNRTTKRSAARTAARATKRGTRPEARPTRTRHARETPAVDPVRERLSKTAIVDEIAEMTELDKKAVRAVMGALTSLIHGSLTPKGCGQFILPNVCRFTIKDIPAKKVPAVKGGEEAVNRFTGETYITQSRPAFVKPANVKVQVRASKALKDVAGVKTFSAPKGRDVAPARSAKSKTQKSTARAGVKRRPSADTQVLTRRTAEQRAARRAR